MRVFIVLLLLASGCSLALTGPIIETPRNVNGSIVTENTDSDCDLTKIVGNEALKPISELLGQNERVKNQIKDINKNCSEIVDMLNKVAVKIQDALKFAVGDANDDPNFELLVENERVKNQIKDITKSYSEIVYMLNKVEVKIHHALNFAGGDDNDDPNFQLLVESERVKNQMRDITKNFFEIVDMLKEIEDKVGDFPNSFTGNAKACPQKRSVIINQRRLDGY